jgi:hypothetical protein
MIRERERRREPARLLEAALWASMSPRERLVWRRYSDAVAQVRAG